MIKNRLNQKMLLLIGAWLFLGASCQPTSSGANEATVATETATSEQVGVLPNAATIVSTRLISQTDTPIWTPTPLPTLSPTPQPSATTLPTETMTPTPWPTLPTDEAAQKVLSLLQDNQNPDCLLPCWWGAIPGQTRWQDLNSYLKSFALAIEYFPEQSIFVAMFSVSESINYRGKLNIGYTVNTSEIVTDISIASINTEGYDPQTMMALYGVPDEVWLKTFNDLLPGEVLPFQLIIVYQQQGISFHYYVDAIKNSDMVTACFEPGVVELERPDLFPAGPRIYLWEPDEHKDIEEIANIPLEIYYPLEEKTEWTPQTFYEKFTNPNEQPCIDTAVELW